MIKLTKLDIQIADYLKENHKRDNPIAMSKLAKMFGIKERELRLIIEKIIISQRLVIGNVGGYWVAETEEEINEANLIHKSRLETSIRRLVANKGSINWIHKYLNELNNKYEKVAEGQLSIYESHE